MPLIFLTILLDFVPGMGRYQRGMVWIEAVIVAAVVLLAAVITLEPLFG